MPYCAWSEMAQYSTSAIYFRVPSLKLSQIFFSSDLSIYQVQKNRNSVALYYGPFFSNLIKASTLENQPFGRSCILTVGGALNTYSYCTNTKQCLCPVLWLHISKFVFWVLTSSWYVAHEFQQHTVLKFSQDIQHWVQFRASPMTTQCSLQSLSQPAYSQFLRRPWGAELRTRLYHR